MKGPPLTITLSPGWIALLLTLVFHLVIAGIAFGTLTARMAGVEDEVLKVEDWVVRSEERVTARIARLEELLFSQAELR